MEQCDIFVVVYTDLSCKELHSQVGVDREQTFGALGGVMIGTLAWDIRGTG